MIYAELLPLEVGYRKSENIAAMLLSLIIGLGATSCTVMAYGMKSGFPIGALMGVMTYTTCMLMYHRYMFGIGRYFSAQPKYAQVKQLPELTQIVQTTSITVVERHFWVCFSSTPLAVLGLAVMLNWSKLSSWFLFV